MSVLHSAICHALRFSHAAFLKLALILGKKNKKIRVVGGGGGHGALKWKNGPSWLKLLQRVCSEMK